MTPKVYKLVTGYEFGQIGGPMQKVENAPIEVVKAKDYQDLFKSESILERENEALRDAIVAILDNQEATAESLIDQANRLKDERKEFRAVVRDRMTAERSHYP